MTKEKNKDGWEEEFEKLYEPSLLDGKNHHQWLPYELRGFILRQITKAKAEGRREAYRDILAGVPLAESLEDLQQTIKERLKN